MLKYEIFSPSNPINNKIYSIVEKLTVTAAKALIDYLHGKTKATEKYLSSSGEEFFWGKNSPDINQACLGKFEVIDPADRASGDLTCKIQ